MRWFRVAAVEVGYQTLILWRNPLAASFTVAFPLLFLVLFNLLSPGGVVDELGGVPFAQFFTPAIAVFAVVTAGYTNLAITTSIDRDEGILKRMRGTPMPAWVFLTGRVGAAVGTGLASVVVMVVVGVAAFDVDLLVGRLPTALLVLAVGAGTFSILGLAVAGAAPNGQAAPPIANATILPLAFISGIFFPIETAPGWLQTLAAIFPLRPFVVAFVEQWNPAVDPGFPALELVGMLIWAGLGLVVAGRTFTWEPRPGGARRGRS